MKDIFKDTNFAICNKYSIKNYYLFDQKKEYYLS